MLIFYIILLRKILEPIRLVLLIFQYERSKAFAYCRAGPGTLAQGLRSAELTALLARVLTETLVSRFYSLLTSDRGVLEIIL